MNTSRKKSEPLIIRTAGSDGVFTEIELPVDDLGAPIDPRDKTKMIPRSPFRYKKNSIKHIPNGEGEEEEKEYQATSSGLIVLVLMLIVGALYLLLGDISPLLSETLRGFVAGGVITGSLVYAVSSLKSKNKLRSLTSDLSEACTSYKKEAGKRHALMDLLQQFKRDEIAVSLLTVLRKDMLDIRRLNRRIEEIKCRWPDAVNNEYDEAWLDESLAPLQSEKVAANQAFINHREVIVSVLSNIHPQLAGRLGDGFTQSSHEAIEAFICDPENKSESWPVIDPARSARSLRN